MEQGLSVLDQLRGGAATLNIGKACRVLGISVSHGYALAKTDNFPCRVIRAGNRYMVVTASLLALLEGDVAEAA